MQEFVLSFVLFPQRLRARACDCLAEEEKKRGKKKRKTDSIGGNARRTRNSSLPPPTSHRSRWLAVTLRRVTFFPASRCVSNRCCGARYVHKRNAAALSHEKIIPQCARTRCGESETRRATNAISRAKPRWTETVAGRSVSIHFRAV